MRVIQEFESIHQHGLPTLPDEVVGERCPHLHRPRVISRHDHIGHGLWTALLEDNSSDLGHPLEPREVDHVEHPESVNHDPDGHLHPGVSEDPHPDILDQLESLQVGEIPSNQFYSPR